MNDMQRLDAMCKKMEDEKKMEDDRIEHVGEWVSRVIIVSFVFWAMSEWLGVWAALSTLVMLALGALTSYVIVILLLIVLVIIWKLLGKFLRWIDND